jgi:hypothetical protein
MRHDLVMNLNFRPSNLAQSNPRLSVNVIVAYEDFSTGNHALNIFERLFPGLGQPPLFSTHNVWKFDLLEIAKFREIAAREAAAADIILISAHGPGELPTTVKRWMELWITQRHSDPGALVVLLDGIKKPGLEDLRAEAYLRDCAIRAGMDFFIQREKQRQKRSKDDPRLNLEKELMPAAALEKIITGVPWRAEYN